MTDKADQADKGLEITTEFVRHRNALLARASFGDLYVDYYLHLGQNGLKPEPEQDGLFKRALAAFALHCASRPRNEMIAWTMNFQSPRLNVFLTGDNSIGSVVGRIFTENVKEGPDNLFFSEVYTESSPMRRSSVTFEGDDPFHAAEAYYRQSEQRPAGYFQTGDEEFSLVSAHPDCDMAWFEALDLTQVKELGQKETLSLIERRVCRWHCGCSHERMLGVLAPVMQKDPDELFDGTEAVTIHCPRCAAKYTITREALEAFVAHKK